MFKGYFTAREKQQSGDLVEWGDGFSQPEIPVICQYSVNEVGVRVENHLSHQPLNNHVAMHHACVPMANFSIPDGTVFLYVFHGKGPAKS
jgi:hypothetical protein